MNYIDETPEQSAAGIELLFILEGKEPIETLHHLYKMAEAKKAVHCPKLRCFAHRIPAVFVMNMQGTVINSLFNSGLWVYQGKVKP